MTFLKLENKSDSFRYCAGGVLPEFHALSRLQKLTEDLHDRVVELVNEYKHFHSLEEVNNVDSQVTNSATYMDETAGRGPGITNPKLQTASQFAVPYQKILYSF
jgi:hypothetical protein